MRSVAAPSRLIPLLLFFAGSVLIGVALENEVTVETDEVAVAEVDEVAAEDLRIAQNKQKFRGFGIMFQ